MKSSSLIGSAFCFEKKFEYAYRMNPLLSTGKNALQEAASIPAPVPLGNGPASLATWRRGLATDLGLCPRRTITGRAGRAAWLRYVGLAFFTLLVVCFSSSRVTADLSDDFHPVWEFLLWGGTGASTEGREPSSRSEPADLVGPLSPVFVDRHDCRLVSQSPFRTSADFYRAPFRTLFLRNIPPLYVTPQLPGEGIWQSPGLPTSPDGQPLMYRTSYRPSVEHPNAIVHMLLLDMTRLSINLYVGSAEPGGSRNTSMVEPEKKPLLAAITNALWKQKHSVEGGTVHQGRVIKELSPGVATFVVYQDGSLDLLEWHEGIPPSLVKDAKQLKHLIVKDSKVVDTVIRSGQATDSEIGLGFLLSEDQPEAYPSPWYYGMPNARPGINFGADWFIATRSAFGIRSDGNLVFAVGHHISTKDLAKALVLAGCERAIHGDANPHNVLGNIYYPASDGSILRKEKLSPDQRNGTLDRYVDTSYTSDFFAFFLRTAERGGR